MPLIQSTYSSLCTKFQARKIQDLERRFTTAGHFSLLAVRARKSFEKRSWINILDTGIAFFVEYILLANDTLGGVGGLSSYRELIVWTKAVPGLSLKQPLDG